MKLRVWPVHSKHIGKSNFGKAMAGWLTIELPEEAQNSSYISMMLGKRHTYSTLIPIDTL